MSKCPACGVRIEGDRVLFSHSPNGEPGTKERLYARVCQFAKKPGCINTGQKEAITEADGYGSPSMKLMSYEDAVKMGKEIMGSLGDNA